MSSLRDIFQEELEYFRSRVLEKIVGTTEYELDYITLMNSYGTLNEIKYSFSYRGIRGNLNVRRDIYNSIRMYVYQYGKPYVKNENVELINEGDFSRVLNELYEELVMNDEYINDTHSKN